MTYDALVERNVPQARAEIFAALTDFGAVGELVPEAVSHCECIGEGVGALRRLTLAQGGNIVERMDVAFDDSVFAYSLIENDVLPLDHYCAVVTLTDIPEGGTHITWGSNWTPRDDASEDELCDLLQGMYNLLLDAITRPA